MADLQGWVLPPKFLNTCRSCVCENTWSQTPVSHAKFSSQCFWLAFLNTSASAITGWSVYVFRLLDGWFLQWLFNEPSVLNIWVLGCVGCVGSLWFNSWHSWGCSSKTCMSRSHFWSFSSNITGIQGFCYINHSPEVLREEAAKASLPWFSWEESERCAPATWAMSTCNELELNFQVSSFKLLLRDCFCQAFHGAALVT